MEDFVSILKSRNPSTPNTVWAGVHLEDRPANIQILRLKQDSKTGLLTAVRHWHTVQVACC